MVALMATASTAFAGSDTGTATITLLINGSSEVQYADVSSGFRLEVYLSAEDETGSPVNMKAAGVRLDGDPGFHYQGMTDFYGLAVYNYGDVTGPPPTNAQGWSCATADVDYVPAGNLPLTGGLNNELGTVAASLAVGCTAGFYAYLDFDAVPVVEASLPLGIAPNDTSYVGGMDDVAFGSLVLEGVSIIPEPTAVLLLIGALPFLRRRR
jgi:hypothetical protein